MPSDKSSEFDYVIVGAGSAGCVLANRLSASGRNSVLLLESGRADDNIWLKIPLGYGKTIYNPKYSRHYHTEAEGSLGDRRIFWPRGHCLGGSSSINGLICVRGHKDDYDSWASAGNEGWSWSDVLPFFVKSESNSRGASPFHGAQGPIGVEDSREADPLSELLFTGCKALGLEATPDFNDGSQAGYGYYQFFTKNRRRSSAAAGYLRDLQPDKLTTGTRAHASRILFDGSRATGVSYLQDGQQRLAHARKEVILAAGAIGSPQLLQLSGIGDPALLKPLGIEMVCESPDVGRNLQDHIRTFIVCRTNDRLSINHDLRSFWGRLNTGARYLFGRSGPLAYSAVRSGVFAQVLDGGSRPDVQFLWSPMSSHDAPPLPDAWPGCALSICQLRPESRGHLEIRSTDPFSAPRITANYFASQKDRDCIIGGIKLTREIIRHASRKGELTELGPGSDKLTDAELWQYVQGSSETLFHPVGTCRMGPDDSAVVDHRLKVKGVSNLRVVDGSIMPSLISGNTNAAIIMIAEKASAMILAGD